MPKKPAKLTNHKQKRACQEKQFLTDSRILINQNNYLYIFFNYRYS